MSVTKNRAVLSKIIYCIKFCGNFELPLKGHDEHNVSLNPGVFRGLLDFTSSLNTSFKSHLESAAVFKGSFKTIQNKLLGSILEICKQEIKDELSTVNLNILPLCVMKQLISFTKAKW